MTAKKLDLKVTVTGEDPDATLARMDKGTLRLTASPYALKVTKLERADGEPFGLESEFEAYWSESHCEGDDGEPGEKLWAREAFLYGVRIGKGLGKR